MTGADFSSRLLARDVCIRAKIALMERVFLSHSSRDSRQAEAVKKWLIEQELGLAEEIFLDRDAHTGIRHCQLEQSEGDFCRFASATHQVASDV